MAKTTKLFALNLQLLAEGAGVGTSVSGADNNGAVAQPKDGSITDNGDVQVADAQNNESADLDAEFKDLIKGKYKSQYDQTVKKVIADRFKNSDDASLKLKNLSPALELLGERYGIDATNIDALVNAISEDNSFYEDAAMEAGMSVENFKAMQRIQRENREFKARETERAEREAFNQMLNSRRQEGEMLKQLYPDFDLDAELQNERFFNLMCTPGLSLRDAYEVMHRDDIVSGLVAQAAKQTQKQVADNIAANAKRPDESGIANHNAANTRVDVSKLTDKQLDEYARRVQRGEKISFSQ